MSAPPLRADQEVARILAESDSEEEIYRLLLAAIGDSLGWELGAIWASTPTATSCAASTSGARPTPGTAPRSSPRRPATRCSSAARASPASC